MSWDFIKITYPRAAKPHKCEEAGCVIEAGEIHAYHAGRVEGDFTDYRLCMTCSELAQAYCEMFDDGEGFPMGELRQRFAEEGYTDEEALVAHIRAERVAKLERSAQTNRIKAVAYEVEFERRRQVEAEGYSSDRDDGYVNGELARAAAAYALVGNMVGAPAYIAPIQLWPWSSDTLKADPIELRGNLVKAGALVLAEIERIDRRRVKAGDRNG